MSSVPCFASLLCFSNAKSFVISIFVIFTFNIASSKSFKYPRFLANICLNTKSFLSVMPDFFISSIISSNILILSFQLYHIYGYFFKELLLIY